MKGPRFQGQGQEQVLAALQPRGLLLRVLARMVEAEAGGHGNGNQRRQADGNFQPDRSVAAGFPVGQGLGQPLPKLGRVRRQGRRVDDHSAKGVGGGFQQVRHSLDFRQSSERAT